MKIPRVVLTIIGCAAFMQAISVALAMSHPQAPATNSSATASKDPVDVAKPLPQSDQQTNPKSAIGPGETRDTSRAKRPGTHAASSKVNRANQGSRKLGRTTAGNAANHLPPGPTAATAGARNSTVENKAANGARPARSVGSTRLTTSPATNVRHHSPNPAIVGGFSSTKRNGSLDGSQMNRKP